jgi:hypothetical protein
MNAYATFSGFENAVWTLATRTNRSTKIPAVTVLKRLFARCLKAGWPMDAESVINAFFDGTLPARFKRVPPEPSGKSIAELQTELAIVNAQISSHLERQIELNRDRAKEYGTETMAKLVVWVLVLRDQFRVLTTRKFTRLARCMQLALIE